MTQPDNDTQPPAPDRVSDEERTAAIKAVAVMLAWGHESETVRRMGDARAVVNGLISHGWRPNPAASTSDTVNVNGDLFEVIEWSLKDHDIDGDGTHEYTLYAREVTP